MKHPAFSFAVLAVALLLLSTSTFATVVYVKWDSPGPIFDGTTWDKAFHTVNQAIAIVTSGDEIRIATGKYYDIIWLRPGLTLLGGYAGVGEVRDIKLYETTLHGNGYGYVVVYWAGGTETAKLEGFTLSADIRCENSALIICQNAIGSIECYASSPTIQENTIGEIYCYNHSSPDILDNTTGRICCYDGSCPSIVGNIISGAVSMSDGGGGIYCYKSSPTISDNQISDNTTSGNGGGIRCDTNCSPIISNNTITGNTSEMGGGISCSYSSPTITGNVITGNVAEYGFGGGGGIHLYSSSPVVSGNTITGNAATGKYGSGGGIECSSSSPTILNNRISGNSAVSYGGGIDCGAYCSSVVSNNVVTGNSATYGGGVYCNSASPTLVNNTIAANDATYGGGVYCEYYDGPALYNNILAFNSSGIRSSTSSPTLRNNCVYGNTDYNYFGLSPGVGDISVDPLLADVAYGNVHIQPGSLCVNAGWNDALGLTSTDLDGQARVQSATVDIGVDESDGTSWSAGPYVIVRVSSTGNDSNDGSSWTLAKRTVQAGIDAASSLGGEVWVKCGVYDECILLGVYAYVYGGFAGTETSKSERRWKLNITALDGGGDGPVVTAIGVGRGQSAVDGFTIRNGYSQYRGGGVYCLCASPTIANNAISGNITDAYGGGVNCHGSSPVVTNNTITGNTGYGGGIRCYKSSPAITNNTITGNSSDYGCGGVDCERSSPGMSNNIIAFNSSGISSDGNGLPALRNNCVYGNTSYDYLGVSAGIGDVSLDPLLADWPVGDCHLTPPSPCINAGRNDAPYLPSVDMDGDSRVVDGVVDIGADEYIASSPEVVTISEAKSGPDETLVRIDGAIVSAVWEDVFYVEADDRSCGVRVEMSAHGLNVATRANVTGTVRTNMDSERYIAAEAAAEDGTGSVPPVAMRSVDLGGSSIVSGQCGVFGGSGLNNIGLLVRTWGLVTQVGEGYLYLDDGSNLRDGTSTGEAENVGVRVICDPAGYSSGEKVEVTGISSCFWTPSGIARRILTRRPEDVRKIGL